MTTAITFSSKASIVRALLSVEEFEAIKEAIKDIPSGYISALHPDLFDSVFHLNSFYQSIEEALNGIKEELPPRNQHAFLHQITSGACKAINEVSHPYSYALAELFYASKGFSDRGGNFYLAAQWASMNSSGDGSTEQNIMTRSTNRWNLKSNHALSDADTAESLMNELILTYNDMGAMFFYVNLLKDDIPLDPNYFRALKAYTRFKNKIAAARNNDPLM